MKISYSAPAKIILSGEHASVYGKPTLISALDLRLTVTIIAMMVTKKDSVMAFISQTVLEYLKENKIHFDKKPYGFNITSAIPSGRNLGSSAALSVAASAAFLHFYTGKQFPKDVINLVAYEVEKNFHGNPSGGDNSASCFGGLIYFRKEFEFLKSVNQLPFVLPEEISNSLFIIDSGKPMESTNEMVVEVVGLQYKRNSKKLDLIFSEIEVKTKNMVKALYSNDLDIFIDSIGDNERLLEELGVVSNKTKALLKNLVQFGTGKVTGGGGLKRGSGNILFCADDSIGLKTYLETKKINYFQWNPSKEGVRRL